LTIVGLEARMVLRAYLSLSYSVKLQSLFVAEGITTFEFN